MGRMVRIVAVVAVALVSAGCWPMPGQNPDRTGFNPLETDITAENVGELTEKWTFAPPDPRPVKHPVVSPGGVHVTFEGTCSIETLDAATGQSRWTAGLLPIGTDCSQIPFTSADMSDLYVEGNHVSAGAGVHNVRAPGPPRPPAFSVFSGSFDVATGVRVTTGWTGAAAGIIEGQRGNVAAGSTGYYDIERQEVALSARLSSPAGGRALAIPGGIVDSATVGAEALFHAGNGLIATEPGGGNFHGPGVRAYSLTEARPGCGTPGALEECPLWATSVDGPVAGRPIVRWADVLVGMSAGTMYNVDGATGGVLWTARVGSPVTASPAVFLGDVFVPTASGDLVVVSTGSHLWSGSTGSPITVQPAVVGDVVITGSADGSLHAFPRAGCGADTCEPLWTARTGSRITGAPAITDGQLYVGTEDGRVIAYALP